ncbi:MAG TPA: hypothetical protein VLQ45_28915 [Thermoanaerobaculia bacterium]|nr:hypothetical protein [Thermoanaerobaculia bacterium]
MGFVPEFQAAPPAELVEPGAAQRTAAAGKRPRGSYPFAFTRRPVTVAVAMGSPVSWPWIREGILV